jgi:hypothetical protein
MRSGDREENRCCSTGDDRSWRFSGHTIAGISCIYHERMNTCGCAGSENTHLIAHVGLVSRRGWIADRFKTG